MQEIQNWLDNPGDIEIGRKLYNLYAPRYKPSAVISAQINKFDNSYTRELLGEELGAILDLISKAVNSPRPESAKYHTRGSSEDLPEDLKALDEQIPLLFKKRDACRYAMRSMDTGLALRDMAYKAVTYDQEIRRIYKILDFFSRTGNYPPDWKLENPEQTEVDKLIFWLKAQRAYPRWIARNKNNPDKAAELKERQDVLNEISKYLRDADKEE